MESAEIATALATVCVLYSLSNIFVLMIVNKCEDCSSPITRKICKRLSLWYHKIAAWRHRGQAVFLMDYRGYTSVSVAFTENHGKWSYAYYCTGTGTIYLQDDGTVSNVSGYSSHVKYWLPVDTQSRTWMILQGARGFEY